MKIWVFTAIALLLSTTVLAEDLYLVTLDVKDGQYTVADKQLVTGFAPEVRDGATYAFTKNGEVVGTGEYSLPSGIVGEEFHEDGTIEGGVQPLSQIVVIIPAVAEADTLELSGANNQSLVKVSLKEPENIVALPEPQTLPAAPVETAKVLQEKVPETNIWAWIAVFGALGVAGFAGLVILAIIIIIIVMRRKK